LTSFESFFSALKKALMKPRLYDIWPDFEPFYDENEYSWTTLRGLGNTLLLNCGGCDGPSDVRHARCEECVGKRSGIASEAYTSSTGRDLEKWPTIMLCRIHSPD
jgi:hypothetical protein